MDGKQGSEFLASTRNECGHPTGRSIGDGHEGLKRASLRSAEAPTAVWPPHVGYPGSFGKVQDRPLRFLFV